MTSPNLLSWPLDWPAEPFLTFYVLVTLASVVAALRIQGRIGGAGPGVQQVPLRPLQLAYLAGGPVRTANTALLGLLAAGGATLDPKHNLRILSPPDTLPSWLDGFRRSAPGVTSPQQFLAASKPAISAIRSGLAMQGLAPTPVQQATRTGRALCILLLPLLLGVAKVMVGQARHRPTGILTLLLVVTGVVGLFILAKPSHRTRAGLAALQRNREHHARAARAPLDHELPLAFALTGAAVLAGTEFAGLGPRMRAAETGSNSGGDSGCTGDSGGDGGGSGCGGCSGG